MANDECLAHDGMTEAERSAVQRLRDDVGIELNAKRRSALHDRPVETGREMGQCSIGV